MCGIFGGIKQGVQPIDSGIIRALALANRERGKDSIGFFARGFTSLRKAQDPLAALASKQFRRYIDKWCARSWFFAGHTRFATQGKVCTDNAHPFYYKGAANVMGAHNGTCWAPSQYTVDSEYLFDLLATHGSAAYQKALQHVRGYWSLSWYDGRHFYLMAHSNTIAFGNRADCFYYSSEASHLRACGVGVAGELTGGAIVRFAPNGRGEELKAFKSRAKSSYTGWGKGNYHGRHSCGYYYGGSRAVSWDGDTAKESESATESASDSAGDLPDEERQIVRQQVDAWADSAAQMLGSDDFAHYRDRNGYADDLDALVGLESEIAAISGRAVDDDDTKTETAETD